VTGIDESGAIVCSVGCPSTVFHFYIVSAPQNLIENWPGGTYTRTAGAGCSVTVQAPSGSIALLGGTVSVDAWAVVAKTGFGSASGTAQTPGCGGAWAAASVASNRPTCSNASTVFEVGHSGAQFDVAAS
jgi:hypothetical protein